MKKGKVLMIVGGGLLVLYLAVLFVVAYPAYSSTISWLQGLPLLTQGCFVAVALGDLKGASLGVLFSAGIITLVTGACMSVFNLKMRKTV